MSQCPLGRSMRKLGDTMIFGGAAIKAKELDKDRYLELKEMGVSDREIREMYGIKVSCLYKRKKYWGLVEKKEVKRFSFSLEQYWKWKKLGYSDHCIAKLFKISYSLLIDCKRVAGIIPNYKTKIIQFGANGEEIKPETYILLKRQGMPDEVIWTRWGINRNTLQRRKREWRALGHNIDFYRKSNASYRQKGEAVI